MQVWITELKDSLQQGDLALLDRSELLRLGQFKRTLDQSRYGSMHASIKRIIAQYLGLSPNSVVLGRQACPQCGSPIHGPPILVRPEATLSLSWSRSDQFGLLCFAQSDPIGADLEIRRVPFSDLEAIVDTLSPSELRLFENISADGERESFLLRCWTRKEAVLKAAGIGLSVDLTLLNVIPDALEPAAVQSPNPLLAGILVRSFTPAELPERFAAASIAIAYNNETRSKNDHSQIQIWRN